MKYIWFIVFFAAYVLYLRYLMHMFQLNSYKAAEQNNWMKKNRGVIVLHAAFSVVSFIVLAAAGRAGVIVSAVIWLLAVISCWPRKKAKKPLVCTARVIRMFVTHAVLFLIVIAASCFFSVDMYAACIMYLVLPILILFVNVINMPIQKMVNRRFINEAKKKIQSMPDLKVVGITGSYGKTSVKFFLTELLLGKFNVLCTPLNYNTELGVTKTIRENLLPIHEIFVCEMGARYVNDIQAICDIVHPRYGVITSIGPQHLESFGSIENIVKTKFELYESIPDDGMMFLNYDNEYIRNYKGMKPQTGFGCSPDAQFRLLNMDVSASGTVFRVDIPGEGAQEFATELIGEHNVLDITAAIAVAYSLGVTVPELKKRVKKIRPVEHRLQLLPRRGRITIIDDAYNSNPNGFRSAVDTLNYFSETKVLITPGMIELGEKQYELNYEAGRHASEVCDYIILVGRNQTKPLQDGIKSNEKFGQERLRVVNTLSEAMQLVPGLSSGELVVLLENDLPDNY